MYKALNALNGESDKCKSLWSINSKVNYLKVFKVKRLTSHTEIPRHRSCVHDSCYNLLGPFIFSFLS